MCVLITACRCGCAPAWVWSCRRVCVCAMYVGYEDDSVGR